MQIRKVMGLKTEPCGTHALGLIWLDRKLFTLTCITRPTKKSESQRVIFWCGGLTEIFYT